MIYEKIGTLADDTFWFYHKDFGVYSDDKIQK